MLFWNIVALGLSVFVCIQYWDYTNPNDQFVEFKLHAEIDIPVEHTMPYPPTLTWHAAYESFGLCPESSFFDPEDNESWRGFVWPEMDFDNHTYIITYGKELISLSYNVWEVVELPHRNGAKVGNAVLGDAFDQNKIYVYEIPKIRIDNNI